MPADIAAGGSQSFVIALTPTAMFNATDVVFTMKCANYADGCEHGRAEHAAAVGIEHSDA